MEDLPNTPAGHEIQRLNQLASHLEHIGEATEGARVRQDARALAAAEVQRHTALTDAHQQVTELCEQLQHLWQQIEPHDSFDWFLRYSDEPAVEQLRDELVRQKHRIVILEAAR